MNNNPSDKTPVTPSPDWANWALLQAWFTHQSQGNPVLDSDRPALAEMIINRFAAILGEGHNWGDIPLGPRSYVVLTNAGLWGRGKTLVDAVKATKSYSKTHKVTAVLVLNDDKPTVDGYGTVHSSSVSSQFNLGVVGTVGSILNVNKT